MSRPDELIAANDEQDVVDLLIKAHCVCKDDITRDLIELALLNEGQRISRQMRKSEQSA